MNNSTESVLTEITSQGVATLTFNRPEVHNAFDINMIEAISSALAKIAANNKVKMLVLKGNGKSFSAGGDLKWMQRSIHFTQEENYQEGKALAQMMYDLYHFTKPTLAMVQGAAFGGGAGLVACCQIVIAASTATFCFPECKLGLIPAVISPYVIRAIGTRKARFYFLTATQFDAENAYKMGLCHEIAPADKLESRAEYWVNTLLQNGPHALEECNKLINALDPITSDNMIELTAQKIAELRVSPEGVEGIKAFLERRKPLWIK
ncbi:MAG: enoyl-CoA hydratase-related protein [Candidatus Berkiellales bacterium]